MSIEDTNSVKYILEEMDPAEKVEFERLMASDPDLRIEVESIRRMNGKLDALPKLSPPKHLTDRIISVAADQSDRSTGFKGGYLLSAAVVILGLTTGSLILQNSFEESGLPDSSTAGLSSYENGIPQTEEVRSPDLQPWVDRQDVLRLTGFDPVTNSLFFKEGVNNANKLRPVGKFSGSQPFGRSVQLTGSNR